MVSAAAVFRTSAPTPKAIKPHTSAYSAVMSTDRSAPGWASETAACVLPSSAWPRKNAPKLVTTATPRLIAAKIASLAP